MWGPRGGRPSPGSAAETAPTREDLVALVAIGDHRAFEQLYDQVAGQVLGLVRRVLRDPAQSEEVAQEVFLEVWRTAPHHDPGRGTAMAWILTLAHRRAVDRVRAAQAASDREAVVGQRDLERPYDVVGETVETRLEHESVRAALSILTDLQRQAIDLAYYGGYTYPEVATLLGVPLGTVKTRIRDGLIRLRDAMGVTA